MSEEGADAGIITLETLGISWLPSKRKPEKRLEELISERIDEIVRSEEESDLLRGAETFSLYVDDLDVLKVGWHLGVRKYGKRRAVAGIVGYEEWPAYSGLSREVSEQINNWLWDVAFRQRIFDLEKLTNSLSRRFGLEKTQAERIVRTEMANIFNKMREWAYLTETGALRFRWVAKMDACEKCLEVEERSRHGVTMEELKALILHVGGEQAREWTVHPNCRCTFKAIRGGRGVRRWEKVG